MSMMHKKGRGSTPRPRAAHDEGLLTSPRQQHSYLCSQAQVYCEQVKKKGAVRPLFASLNRPVGDVSQHSRRGHKKEAMC